MKEAKIAKNENIAKLIEAEEEKLSKFLTKQAELDEKIKQCRKNITKYKLMRKTERLNELSNTLDKKGISIDDIISAIESGDFDALQNNG